MTKGLDLWREVSDPLQQARTLARLEHALTAIGDADAAAACSRQWRQILADAGAGTGCLRLPS